MQVSAGAVVLTDAVFWGLIVPFMSSSSAHSSPNAVSGRRHYPLVDISYTIKMKKCRFYLCKTLLSIVLVITALQAFADILTASTSFTCVNMTPSLLQVMGCIHSLNLVFLLTETALNTLVRKFGIDGTVFRYCLQSHICGGSVVTLLCFCRPSHGSEWHTSFSGRPCT